MDTSKMDTMTGKMADDMKGVSSELAEKSSSIIEAGPTSLTCRQKMMQFPLLVTLSMTLSFTLLAFASDYTSGDLAVVSARRDSWPEVVGILSWRVVELAIGWFVGYDSKHASS